MVVDRRRYARPDTRPRVCGQVQELPLVVQPSGTRRTDVRIVAIDGGGPGNRNDPIHYRASSIGVLCRDHHRVLADGGYRGIAELITPVFHNNRIVRDRRWRAHRRRRARVEHAIARLKSWRVLRDHRRRGQHLLATARAVAFLHNLSLDGLRDSP